MRVTAPGRLACAKAHYHDLIARVSGSPPGHHLGNTLSLVHLIAVRTSTAEDVQRYVQVWTCRDPARIHMLAVRACSGHAGSARRSKPGSIVLDAHLRRTALRPHDTIAHRAFDRARRLKASLPPARRWPWKRQRSDGGRPRRRPGA